MAAASGSDSNHPTAAAAWMAAPRLVGSTSRQASLVCRPGEIFDGYVFDLDGTVYLGDDLLPGSARLLTALRELGRRVAFASNNPTRTPAQYADKHRELGVQASESEVINSLVITVDCYEHITRS